MLCQLENITAITNMADNILENKTFLSHGKRILRRHEEVYLVRFGVHFLIFHVLRKTLFCRPPQKNLVNVEIM